MKKVLPGHFKNLSRGLISLLLFLVITLSGYSQNVTISAGGIVPPEPSAGLDLSFSAQGLLIPRVALISATSFSPLAGHVAGMIVYNTSTTGDLTPGFYHDNGSKWISGLPQGNTAGDMQYWDGNAWQAIPAGQPGQLLQVNSSGIPSWSGAGYATLTTAVISNLTSTTATSGGSIGNDGGTAVTSYGVCWSTSPNPTTAASKTVDGSGIGTFVSNLTGLVTGTTYYVRSYAINGTGTTYGNQFKITTP